MNVNDNSWVRE